MGTDSPLALSDKERVFVDAVTRHFAFLCDLGFVGDGPLWDGRAVSIVHSHAGVRVRNQLEGEEQYWTTFDLLADGQDVLMFDKDLDERFTMFEIQEILDPPESMDPRLATWRYRDISALADAVAARAAYLRQIVEELVARDGAFAARIRDRIKRDRLRVLIPKWEEFTAKIRDGFDGGIADYVAGVNVRGQIGSLLKWPGGTVPEDLAELKAIDQEFLSLTVPVAFGQHGGIYPHQRARSWWRVPEAPRGRLRDYLLRGISRS